MRIKEFFKEFAADESDHDGIEYGLTAAIIAIALIVTFQFFGDQINTWFVTMNSTINNAI